MPVRLRFRVCAVVIVPGCMQGIVCRFYQLLIYNIVPAVVFSDIFITFAKVFHKFIDD